MLTRDIHCSSLSYYFRHCYRVIYIYIYIYICIHVIEKLENTEKKSHITHNPILAF